MIDSLEFVLLCFFMSPTLNHKQQSDRISHLHEEYTVLLLPGGLWRPLMVHEEVDDGLDHLAQP